MFKKILIHMRRGMKITVLSAISLFLIIGAIAFLYKPTYSVFINGEQVGYTENRTGLQKRINEYIKTGEGNNVAFVQVANLPEYRLCLLKKNIVTNDDEIFNNIKEQGVIYYRYYSIAQDEEEKIYISSFEEAEEIVNALKEKNSSNIEKLSIVEKYETELKELSSTDDALSQLFVEAPKLVKTANSSSSSSNKYAATGTVNTALTTSSAKANLGITLIRPVSGTISSRFGAASRLRRSSHTGLDIATSTGTPVAAAASGTVTFSGYKGSYGNLLVITHGNGVQTYYGHCSKLYVSAGTQVSQGQTVAAVGSTGNSTGPHLHLEVRVNGVAYNPQNYLY